MTESQTQEDPQAAGDETGRAVDEPARTAPDSENDDGNARSAGGRGRAVAWFALVIALGAAAATGYPHLQQWLGASPDEPATSALAARIDRLEARLEASAADSDSLRQLRDELAELGASVERLGAEQERSGERLSALSSRLETGQGEREDALGGVRARMERLEGSVGDRLERFEIRLNRLDGQLEGVAAERSIRLALIETDSLLSFAQNRLELGADVERARRAWRRAVATIETLPPGRFAELLEIARDELAQLERFRPSDPESVIQRLFSIARAVPEWPIHGAGAAVADEDGGVPSGESEPSGWRAGLASAFDRLVQVESIETAGMSRIEREQAGARVRVMLETAALALARSDDPLAAALMAEAAMTIPDVFDTADAAVAEALNWLQDYRTAPEAAGPRLNETRERIARLLGEPA